MPVTKDCQGFLGLGTNGTSPSLALSDTAQGSAAVIGLDPADSGKFKILTNQSNPNSLTGSQITIDPIPNGDISLTPNGTGAVNITNANIISGTITLTSATVGNIHVASNTISSTNTNGDIILDPNGTGTVDIAGINSINAGSVAKVVSVGVSDQLGSTVITAGTGITVTPSAQTITIAATGTTNLTYTAVNFAASPYTVLSTDEYLSVDVTGGAVTLRFPNAATSGRVFIVKDKVGLAATNNITLTTVGGAVNIDGAVTYVMNTDYSSVQIIGNAVSYEIF